MIDGSLRTMEVIRDQRFPQIRHGEQKNPTSPRYFDPRHSSRTGLRG